MRDIQLALERWGAWAANNHEDVYWAPIAAGFKGLIPSKIVSRTQCCDDDGLIISSVMAVLNKKSAADHDLLFDYYIFGKTFMELAATLHCSDTHVGKRLQKAEGIVSGMLMWMDVTLEMDKQIQIDIA